MPDVEGDLVAVHDSFHGMIVAFQHRIHALKFADELGAVLMKRQVFREIFFGIGMMDN